MMRRYEGMEELLAQVRERLSAQVTELESAVHTASPSVKQEPEDRNYVSVLNATLILVDDVEQLSDLLTPSRVETLDDEQRASLRSLLARVLDELQSLELSLQR